MNAQSNRLKVLAVDDNRTNLHILQVFLKKLGHEVILAENGVEAVERFAAESPDLILLDIMMPKYSGFEVCEKLKAHAETKSIMILMVTALTELGDIERAVTAGCDDYLSKPVNKAELLKRVENLLKLKTVTNELDRLRRYIDRMEDSYGPKSNHSES